MGGAISSWIASSERPGGFEMSRFAKFPKNLAVLQTPQLVDLFKQVSLAHGEANAEFQSVRANRLIAKRYALLAEMRRRPTDERPALFELYSHRHPQVRLNVATSTYALNPVRALAVMQQIKDSRLFPWAGDAAAHLTGLADGTSKLPEDPELRP